jgi:hypothetical protein
MTKKTITTQMTVMQDAIAVMRVGSVDYISLTDIARSESSRPEVIIQNWMRVRMTIEYLGLWEKLYNQKFKHIEFDVFRGQAGLSSFTLSPKQWIERTSAIGVISRSGKNGGTFAHPDIAFKFASWVSIEFELHLIKEFERLKRNEAYHQQIVWSAHREIAKTNYLIHTQAIKDNIVPKLTEQQKMFIYANEADLLNAVLFGMTAKQWREHNPELPGNIRDYASDVQLKILINIENTNAQLIKEGKNQKQRMTVLHELATEQMKIFTKHRIKRIVTVN